MHKDDSDLDFATDDEYDYSFTLATQHIQSIHSKLMPNDLLELYGLFKQATCGLCTICKPSILSVQARAKWTAWNDLNGKMTTEKAKQMYVEKVKQLDNAWWESIKCDVNVKFPKVRNNWIVHSVPTLPPDYKLKKSDMEKTIFDFVRERNLIQVKKKFEPSSKNFYDEYGMGLIHWAADGNDVEMLEFLLKSGCAIDLRDKEQQQTALHYAVSCGHTDCVRLLLEYGANKSIKDVDGQTCFDVADDPLIRSLLKI